MLILPEQELMPYSGMQSRHEMNCVYLLCNIRQMTALVVWRPIQKYVYTLNIQKAIDRPHA